MSRTLTAAEDTRRASHLISPDALALVRFGLRAADDPRIRDTAKVIDALLKVETPSGPAWHRYNDDGYGEHEDGSPFDGTGIGRGWPLLTGERAHYELAAGRVENAKRLLTALESFANESGLIPEQVWDAPDIPERELHFGRTPVIGKVRTSWFALPPGTEKILSRRKGMGQMENKAKSEVNGLFTSLWGSPLSAACSLAMIRALFPGPYCSLQNSFPCRPPWRKLSSVPF